MNAATKSRHFEAYAKHLAAVAPELVEHEAQRNTDRTLRAYMMVLRELRERRLDALDAILADAEPVSDWEAIGEARRRR